MPSEPLSPELRNSDGLLRGSGLHDIRRRCVGFAWCRCRRRRRRRVLRLRIRVGCRRVRLCIRLSVWVRCWLCIRLRCGRLPVRCARRLLAVRCASRRLLAVRCANRRLLAVRWANRRLLAVRCANRRLLPIHARAIHLRLRRGGSRRRGGRRGVHRGRHRLRGLGLGVLLLVAEAGHGGNRNDHNHCHTNTDDCATGTTASGVITVDQRCATARRCDGARRRRARIGWNSRHCAGERPRAVCHCRAAPTESQHTTKP